MQNRGATLMSYTSKDVVHTIEGLTAKASPVEDDGHISAARHMRNAADMLSQRQLITVEEGFNRFKTALAVQDAVNLRALAREFVKVVDQAAEETKSTEATWADPAVRLFVNKLESLSHSNWNDHFSEAYKACREKAS
jgi:hypothetical protein